MTIRKQWLIALILTAVFSILINTMVLGSLTGRYFDSYLNTSYDTHFAQIVDYTTKALASDSYSTNQIAIELETHLVDPIMQIKVYDANGTLLVNVSRNNSHGMMGGMMRRMHEQQIEEVDHSDLTYQGTLIGQILLVRESSVEKSTTAWLFQNNLLKNSLLSIGIVVLFAIFFGIFISKRMSRDFIHTADYAQHLDMGDETDLTPSRVKEVHVIQQSLLSLKSRLKVRQKSRKALLDELVHQTRTPLTILQTHLEGIEDGVIDMNPEEIHVCKEQIDNITSIISHMSGLIDAQIEERSLVNEPVDLGEMMRQITNGLSYQFEKKHLTLTLQLHQEPVLNLDRHKLSQALYNLLTNAYKFTPPGGTITLESYYESGLLTIKVMDTGIGMDAVTRENLFQAYYKGDIAASGDGLGLFIAKENLTTMNGSITAESSPGKGSTFTITVPCQESMHI